MDPGKWDNNLGVRSSCGHLTKQETKVRLFGPIAFMTDRRNGARRTSWRVRVSMRLPLRSSVPRPDTRSATGKRKGVGSPPSGESSPPALRESPEAPNLFPPTHTHTHNTQGMRADRYVDGNSRTRLVNLPSRGGAPDLKPILVRGLSISLQQTTHSREVEGITLAARHPQQAQGLELGAPQDRLQERLQNKIRRDQFVPAACKMFRAMTAWTKSQPREMGLELNLRSASGRSWTRRPSHRGGLPI